MNGFKSFANNFTKILTILILIALFISSCRVNKHISCGANNHFQIDYSNSVEKPIKYINANTLSDSVKNFEVKISNSHGGRYQITSQIEKSQDSIIVFTQINDMSNCKSDTTLYFSTHEFY